MKTTITHSAPLKYFVTFNHKEITIPEEWSGTFAELLKTKIGSTVIVELGPDDKVETSE